MAPKSREFDPVLLSQVRLGVLSLLATRGPTSFPDLRALLRVTQGNLGAHLRTLEEAGYVSIAKDFVDRKPRTLIRLSDAGRSAMVRHVRELERVLRGTGRE
jgi:DNA-binding MarR family transcriptional regulator